MFLSSLVFVARQPSGKSFHCFYYTIFSCNLCEIDVYAYTLPSFTTLVYMKFSIQHLQVFPCVFLCGFVRLQTLGQIL